MPGNLYFWALTGAISICLTSCATVSRPPETKIGQHAYQAARPLKEGGEYSYLLYLPKDYGGGRKKWPLILFLHGIGERGDNLELVKKHGPPMMVETDPDFPFVVLSPQCPAGETWSPKPLVRLLDRIVEEYAIDRDRAYLTGLSMGGYGAWALATEYPDRFAAVIPIAGGGDPEKACRLENTPMWVFHGADDNAVPLAESEKMVRALKECGGNVRFTVYRDYPASRHDCWKKTYRTPEVFEWLMEQKRY